MYKGYPSVAGTALDSAVATGEVGRGSGKLKQGDWAERTGKKVFK